MFKIMIVVLIVTVVGIVAFMFIDPNMKVTSNNQTSQVVSSNLEGTYSIEIKGEVIRVGTYYAEDTDTLGDVIASAGGLTNNADTDCFFTDFKITGNDSFYIAPIYDNADVCTSEPLTKVNINEDNKAELMEVKTIGDALATAIVSYRDANGSFKRIEDIQNVSGIGPATFSSIKNYIKLVTT